MRSLEGLQSARRDLDPTLRCVVGVVALLNLTYFAVEFAVALAIGSVSLFADSIDFLEDASVNLNGARVASTAGRLIFILLWLAHADGQ
jgi:Co/Zn/Cd efflux system component